MAAKAPEKIVLAGRIQVVHLEKEESSKNNPTTSKPNKTLSPKKSVCSSNRANAMKLNRRKLVQMMRKHFFKLRL